MLKANPKLAAFRHLTNTVMGLDLADSDCAEGKAVLHALSALGQAMGPRFVSDAYWLCSCDACEAYRDEQERLRTERREKRWEKERQEFARLKEEFTNQRVARLRELLPPGTTDEQIRNAMRVADEMEDGEVDDLTVFLIVKGEMAGAR